MLTLHSSRFDFRESFPVPLDEERRRAGRQGLLDQKEDQHVPDAEWVAFQHRAWCEELRACHVMRAYLQACIAACVDPGTGKAPRTPEAWPAIEVRARAEVVHLGVTVGAILSDYADHFGHEAADAFAAFAIAAAMALGDVGPPQRALFAS